MNDTDLDFLNNTSKRRIKKFQDKLKDNNMAKEKSKMRSREHRKRK